MKVAKKAAKFICSRLGHNLVPTRMGVRCTRCPYTESR